MNEKKPTNKKAPWENLNPAREERQKEISLVNSFSSAEQINEYLQNPENKISPQLKKSLLERQKLLSWEEKDFQKKEERRKKEERVKKAQNFLLDPEHRPYRPMSKKTVKKIVGANWQNPGVQEKVGKYNRKALGKEESILERQKRKRKEEKFRKKLNEDPVLGNTQSVNDLYMESLSNRFLLSKKEGSENPDSVFEDVNQFYQEALQEITERYQNLNNPQELQQKEDEIFRLQQWRDERLTLYTQKKYAKKTKRGEFERVETVGTLYGGKKAHGQSLEEASVELDLSAETLSQNSSEEIIPESEAKKKERGETKKDKGPTGPENTLVFSRPEDVISERFSEKGKKSEQEATEKKEEEEKEKESSLTEASSETETSSKADTSNTESNKQEGQKNQEEKNVRSSFWSEKLAKIAQKERESFLEEYAKAFVEKPENMPKGEFEEMVSENPEEYISKQFKELIDEVKKHWKEDTLLNSDKRADLYETGKDFLTARPGAVAGFFGKHGGFFTKALSKVMVWSAKHPVKAGIIGYTGYKITSFLFNNALSILSGYLWWKWIVKPNMSNKGKK